MFLLRLAALPAALILTSTTVAVDVPPVRVIVDMDAATPGIQSSVTVTACTESVPDVAVYILDPLGTRSFYWIGYVGGVDRGISFGHVPDNGNQGTVDDLLPTAGPPLNPGNGNSVTGFVDPAFAGPEVQYIEGGAPTAAVIPSAAPAIFTVNVSLSGAQPGDRFDFHLFDFCSWWPEFGGASDGAFSTQGPTDTRDTGGDSVPDGTVSIHGVDADTPTPLPDAAFLVDYIDGPPGGGPAVIRVIAAPADINGDGAVNVDDLIFVVTDWGLPGGPADVNGDDTVNVDDLIAVLTAWGSCT